ncbi:hypothetical protein ACFP81_01410 [Deinococcus lacus]|uniref:Uncharacterized protein n=1 Tax=Deinococcus lacus TaxID=392561 RepID=A0ABW1Y931_9DEIO
MAGQIGQAGAQARDAQAQARAEGDAPALVAAVTLLGECQWRAATDRAALFAGLRTLAAGLRVAEQTGEHADAHLLAVLSLTQAAVGSPAKAAQTAGKALGRSSPSSPGQVLALLSLGRVAEAQAAARAGELAAGWWAWAVPGGR